MANPAGRLDFEVEALEAWGVNLEVVFVDGAGSADGGEELVDKEDDEAAPEGAAGAGEEDVGGDEGAALFVAAQVGVEGLGVVVADEGGEAHGEGDEAVEGVGAGGGESAKLGKKDKIEIVEQFLEGIFDFGGEEFGDTEGAGEGEAEAFGVAGGDEVGEGVVGLDVGGEDEGGVLDGVLFEVLVESGDFEEEDLFAVAVEALPKFLGDNVIVLHLLAVGAVHRQAEEQATDAELVDLNVDAFALLVEASGVDIGERGAALVDDIEEGPALFSAALVDEFKEELLIRGMGCEEFRRVVGRAPTAADFSAQLP